MRVATEQTTRFLVDGVAAVPILLVVHQQRHRRGGGCEGECIAGGR
jgi:hypothetical protein